VCREMCPHTIEPRPPEIAMHKHEHTTTDTQPTQSRSTFGNAPLQARFVVPIGPFGTKAFALNSAFAVRTRSTHPDCRELAAQVPTDSTSVGSGGPRSPHWHCLWGLGRSTAYSRDPTCGPSPHSDARIQRGKSFRTGADRDHNNGHNIYICKSTLQMFCVTDDFYELMTSKTTPPTHLARPQFGNKRVHAHRSEPCRKA
jgi:hypothetical protein